MLVFLNKKPDGEFTDLGNNSETNSPPSDSNMSELIENLLGSPQTNAPPQVGSRPTNNVVGITLTNLDKENGFGSDFNERLQREGGKTGDVQISLIWNTTDDLDLYCTDPRGEKIYFSKRRSSSGGELDVDMNVGTLSITPVENIFWPVGRAPAGTYKVEVKLFTKRTFLAPISFKVAINYKGTVEKHEGEVTREKQIIRIGSFTVE